jgi:hypothetical protein
MLITIQDTAIGKKHVMFHQDMTMITLPFLSERELKELADILRDAADQMERAR